MEIGSSMWTTIVKLFNNQLFVALFSGIVGYICKSLVDCLKNRVQRIKCFYKEDEVLSKIPQVNADSSVTDNLYCKTYEIKNTTNKDIASIDVHFQFDQSSKIVDSYVENKTNHRALHSRKNYENAAIVKISNFNRGDTVKCVFNVANITDNNYNIQVDACGYKIVCKDRRKATAKSKSHQTNQLLLNH